MWRTLLGSGLILAVSAPAAQAGAWLAPEEGQVITSVGVGARGDVRVTESATHGEQPLSETSALVLTSWTEHAPDLERGWRAEAVFAAKRVLLRGQGRVMAVQGGAYWQSDAPAGCGEGGVEARWLGGASFGATRFLNLEAAGRFLDGGCSRLRLDVTAGIRPRPNWLALGQVFYDAPEHGAATVRAQAGLARFNAAGRGIQAALRIRLDGGDAEPALVLSYWALGPRG